MSATKPPGPKTGAAKHAYLARIQNRANYMGVDLKRIADALNKALVMAEELLEDTDKAVKLKAVHALSITSASLIRILEVGELEARVAEVELCQLAQAEQERLAGE